MKKLGFIFLVLFCFGIQLNAQDTISHNWKKVISYSVDSNEVWNVDVLEYVYISKSSEINKFDSVGVLKFNQSIKSLGRMEQLIPINTMKLIHFSSEQQTLCYFDNTLTQTSDCVELSDRDIINAKLISKSSRPDQVWVFDNLNSTLSLLSVEGNVQSQKIDNLRGVLNINNISQIIERNNYLFILDSEKGVYVFDLYGSLIEFKEIEGVKSIDAFGNSLFMLTDNGLKISFLDDNQVLDISLPQGDFSELKYVNQYFYLRSSKSVDKYILQISK